MDKITSSYIQNKDAVVVIVVLPTRENLTKQDYLNESAACLAYASAIYLNKQEDKND